MGRANSQTHRGGRDIGLAEQVREERRAAADDRLPVPHQPEGLELDAQEGAGEVQTPVSGAAARHMKLGDRVYFRHAKAGELCEHFDSLLLVEGGRVVDEVPTYRGEGKLFL